MLWQAHTDIILRCACSRIRCTTAARGGRDAANGGGISTETGIGLSRPLGLRRRAYLQGQDSADTTGSKEAQRKGNAHSLSTRGVQRLESCVFGRTRTSPRFGYLLTDRPLMATSMQVDLLCVSDKRSYGPLAQHQSLTTRSRQHARPDDAPWVAADVTHAPDSRARPKSAILFPGMGLCSLGTFFALARVRPYTVWIGNRKCCCYVQICLPCFRILGYAVDVSGLSPWT
ncbi:hypothetical protein VFPBJ_00860 [Purpureocillium lilacinum]|uniref:Uncharacterized protein n=1 Tax=Purpureocillium lilacinum TaxID=33203 RepID=A0A179HBA2_PURLI|nr:hypothetical protein VFPBJ_00860 [Purpureocillium lilacinum]